jgi:hypothetical protein
MQVTLTFPPSLCLPNPIYYALPVLAGALKQAGHPVAIEDLNVVAADRLLTAAWAKRVLEHARSAVASGIGDAALATFVATHERALHEGPRCKATLRDPIDNFAPGAFRHAFATVIDALSFYYSRDPVLSPHRPSFGRDVRAHVEADAWTPLRDLYDEVLIDRVLRHEPDLVGITVAFPEQAAESVRLASKLRRRRKSLHICFGGPLISLFPDRWLQDGWLFEYADSVVVGDGESAVVGLAAWLEGRLEREHVPNLVYRGPGGRVVLNDPEPHYEPMDALPVPDFTAAELDLYLTPRPLYTTMVSRGCCWGKCAFCSKGWRKSYRQASTAKLRSDLTALCARHDVRYLYVSDSSVPPSGARRLARVIREEGLPVHWVSAMRFERAFLDPAYCRELAAGGCRSLLIGFETANQRVLDAMHKGVKLPQVPAMLTNLREAGISAELLWFVGFPGETRADVLRTLEFLQEHRDDYGLAAFVGEYTLHPDTPVFDRPRDFGITLTGQENDSVSYVADAGLQMEDKAYLRERLAATENRNLACNGAHLPHLVESGLDLSGIEKPFEIPAEVTTYCRGS